MRQRSQRRASNAASAAGTLSGVSISSARTIGVLDADAGARSEMRASSHAPHRR